MVVMLTDDASVKHGNLSEEIAGFFRDVYPCGVNVLVTGGCNTGKTVQLSRLPLYLDPTTRIITIEEIPEMRLKEKPEYQNYNMASYIVENNEDEEKKYDISSLIRTVLRENPELIMVGEINDSATALSIQEASKMEHSIAATLHASRAKLGAQRMMHLLGDDEIAASQVASTWDLIIHQVNDFGTKRIMEICELIKFDGAEPILNTVFKFDPVEGKHVFVNKLKTLRTKLINKHVSQEIINKWCETL